MWTRSKQMFPYDRSRCLTSADRLRVGVDVVCVFSRRKSTVSRERLKLLFKQHCEPQNGTIVLKVRILIHHREKHTVRTKRTHEHCSTRPSDQTRAESFTGREYNKVNERRKVIIHTSSWVENIELKDFWWRVWKYQRWRSQWRHDVNGSDVQTAVNNSRG